MQDRLRDFAADAPAQAALKAADYEVIAIGMASPESIADLKDYTKFEGAVYADTAKELPVYRHFEMRFRNKTNCCVAARHGIIGTARGIWLAQFKGRKGLVKGLEKANFLVQGGYVFSDDGMLMKEEAFSDILQPYPTTEVIEAAVETTDVVAARR